MKNKFWIYLFAAPTVLVLFLFYLYPIVSVVGTSFTNWSLGGQYQVIGLKNYVSLFQKDVTFLKALTNTFQWLILFCSINVGLGLLVALLTYGKTRFNKFVKSVFVIPNMISAAALGMVFYIIFQPRIGLVNAVIRSLGFVDFNQNWFRQQNTAFFSVTIVSILYAGIITMLISGELAAIPYQIFEAATIDGAGEWKRNIFIIIPMLKNIIATCLILTTAGVFNSFVIIYLTTNGGPGDETMNLALYLYNNSMINNIYGYANAIGVIIFVLGLTITTLITKIFKLGHSYE